MFTKLKSAIEKRGEIVEDKGDTKIVMLDHQEFYEVRYVNGEIESITNMKTKKEYRI